jgi:hypothetical protein
VDGPWRYSHYRLLLFLLELDFRRAEHRDTQRLNYRFHAISAVRIDGLALRKPTFHLTLNSGEKMTVQVTGTDTKPTEPNEDPRSITDLTVDASGLHQTLHVLEGVAAEGKDWVRLRRSRPITGSPNCPAAPEGCWTEGTSPTDDHEDMPGESGRCVNGLTHEMRL